MRSAKKKNGNTIKKDGMKMKMLSLVANITLTIVLLVSIFMDIHTGSRIKILEEEFRDERTFIRNKIRELQNKVCDPIVIDVEDKDNDNK
jgi:hypothetical protein